MDTRTTIRETAAKLFSLKGFDACGISELCESCGVTKPTLYYYFNSKEGLLEAIISEKIAPLIGEIDKTWFYKGDIQNELEGLLYKILQAWGLADKVAGNLYLAMSSNPPESISYQKIEPLASKLHSKLREYFKLAAADHGNMVGRDLEYGFSFLALIHSYLSLVLRGYWSAKRETMAKIVHPFMHGIFS